MDFPVALMSYWSREAYKNKSTAQKELARNWSTPTKSSKESVLTQRGSVWARTTVQGKKGTQFYNDLIF